MSKYRFIYTGNNIKGKVICGPTARALALFCEQEPEFKQAVEQSDKTFDECIDSIAKGIGQSCSDIEVFTKAVNFYFDGATISVQMTINMSGKVEAEHEKANQAEKKPYIKPQVLETPPVQKTENKTLTLSLDDLLDF